MLPIQILKDRIIYEFENLSPDFFNELSDGIKYGQLNSEIIYDDSKKHIVDIAEIGLSRSPIKDGSFEITIYEQYLAFLWALTYNVVFAVNKNIERVDFKDDEYSIPEKLWTYGVSLFEKWSEWNNDLPKPNSDKKQFPYINETNDIFVKAVCFILAHEYSHYYLNHHSKSVEKEDELKADKNASEILEECKKSKGSIEQDRILNMARLVVSISLIFGQKNLNGNSQYPNYDERINEIMKHIEKNCLDKNDMELYWHSGTLLLSFWQISKYKEYKYPLNPKLKAKTNFREMLEQLKNDTTEAFDYAFLPFVV